MVKTPVSFVNADQQAISVLLEKISNLTLQLNQRDVEIANLTNTLRDLDNSRHESTCVWHKPPRKRESNSEDRERITSPDDMQDPPRYEEVINPLLPRHFSETWLGDLAYAGTTTQMWMWADPFVVLAGEQFKAALADDPLTSDLKIKLLGLRDMTQPNATLPFYGIFLGDKTYSKELDDKLNEAMETSAARWKVEKKAMRYMVWNDEIEDEELDDEGEDMEWAVSDAIDEIYNKAREAGLCEPEYSAKT